MDRMKTVEVLRTQGIMAKGYGNIPQIVARDERLNPEAKAIYAYFCSFAGAGFEPVFPSRNLMLKELNMSKDRYYKHLKQLLDLNYVTIERCKIGNLYSKNIYTLITMPDVSDDIPPEQKESIRMKRPVRTVKRLKRRKEDPAPLIAKEEPVIIPERPSEKTTAAAPDQDKPGKAPATAGNRLAAQLGIEALSIKRPEHRELIGYIFMTIEDMAMSEQIMVNGSVKKKDAIRRLIENLRMEHIEALVNNISQSGQTIRRKKAYIQSCIWNIFFDMSGPLDFSPKKSGKQGEESRDESESKKRKALYEQNPALKDLDDQIFALGSKISKAILSGNELQTKALQIERGRLNEKREEMLLQMNVTSKA